jgi:hypothetical protein
MRKQYREVISSLCRAVMAVMAFGCWARSPAVDATGASDSRPQTDSQVLRRLRDEAEAIRPLAEHDMTRRLLDAVHELPAVGTRVVYVDKERNKAVPEAAAAALDEADLAGYERLELDEQYYYYTRYGTPLAYVRAFDVAARYGLADVAGERVLDFGHAGIGQLKLLALLGAHAVGVEVDPVPAALYTEPGEVGRIVSRAGTEGSVTLLTGGYPGDEDVRRAVGGGYRLVISKNVLKRGYVHPAEEVDPRMTVQLGVDDKTFVQTVYAALEPGGLFVIYNLCPASAPSGEPYIPWADGRSPFSREILEEAGFEILAYDEDDTAVIREFGRALGWDQGDEPMDLENDLFAWFTVMRRPGE